MSELHIKEINIVIASQKIGDQILEKIKNILKEEDSVILNFNEVYSMTTSCAKQIFGKLYIEMGAEDFFSKISIINTIDDLKIIINHGIQKALEENEV